MSYATLLVETVAGVATLTLNRPEARNALNQTVIRELGAALAQLDGDPEARVVVIRGAGERAFCAGADLKGMFRTGSILEAREQYAGLARDARSDPRMRAPVIAQVHGYALAGGCGLAAACDLVIAADDAVFGLPEIKLGLLPLMVLAPILRAAAPRRVLELVLTGRELPASRGAGDRPRDPRRAARGARPDRWRSRAEAGRAALQPRWRSGRKPTTGRSSCRTPRRWRTCETCSPSCRSRRMLRKESPRFWRSVPPAGRGASASRAGGLGSGRASARRRRGRSAPGLERQGHQR